MKIVQQLIDWTNSSLLPLGPTGLFILAFMESSFFPIPPDILLIALTLADPSLGLWFATICTIGSVLGGMFGYKLGKVFGNPLLEKFVKKKKIAKVHRLFEKYEEWAIFVAGFSPIPYKVFTVAGGVFYINFKKFVLVSIVSRGLRFFAIAIFLMLYGELIVGILEKYFAAVTLIVSLLIISCFIVYKKLRKRGQLDFM
jgi:membrane protein YqaA with SNARE-associated domain